MDEQRKRELKETYRNSQPLSQRDPNASLLWK